MDGHYSIKGKRRTVDDGWWVGGGLLGLDAADLYLLLVVLWVLELGR